MKAKLREIQRKIEDEQGMASAQQIKPCRSFAEMRPEERPEAGV